MTIAIMRKCNKCGRNIIEGMQCYCGHTTKASHLNK